MTRMGRARSLALGAATLTSMLPALAHAHPGHGAEVGLVHLLTDPYHVLPVFAVAGIVNGLGKLVNVCSSALRYTQSGLFQNYALSMVLGTVVLVAIFILK